MSRLAYRSWSVDISVVLVVADKTVEDPIANQKEQQMAKAAGW